MHSKGKKLFSRITISPHLATQHGSWPSADPKKWSICCPAAEARLCKTSGEQEPGCRRPPHEGSAYTQHHFSAVFCHVSVISLLHLWRLEHVPSETECWGVHPGPGFSLFSGKKINTIIIKKPLVFFVIIERVLWPARHGATMRETSALPVLTMQQCTGPCRQGREKLQWLLITVHPSGPPLEAWE